MNNGERSDDDGDVCDLLSYNPFDLSSRPSHPKQTAIGVASESSVSSFAALPIPSKFDMPSRPSQPAAKKARTIGSTSSSHPTFAPLPFQPKAIASVPILPKTRKAPTKKNTAYALLWICAAGKGQGRNWKQKALKIIGVYASKDGAEAKKCAIMSIHECCGHGDIVVGGTWEDEIDLVVRPVEEMGSFADLPLQPKATTSVPILPKARKASTKTSSTYALLWICAAGRGQGRNWKQKALKVIGVYAGKDGAEAKKNALMSIHQCCGHGDIVVGGTWEDEIDLVVRPVEEMDPNLY